jgi:2-dehydropantoate 2-reductase
MIRPHSCLIVGNGRMARHMARYRELLDLPFERWHRGMDGPLPAASHILLLISDAAIEPFIAQHLSGTQATVVHFSGALATNAAFGAHPLMTFGSDLYDLETYKSFCFVIDADAPDFSNLLPGLPNAHVRLAKEQKTKYHALCSMAGNFSCLLWQKFFDALQKDFNLPPETGQAFLKQQTANLLHDYKTALTGPLARGDMETVDKHMAALQGDNWQAVYRAFVDTYIKDRS